MDRGQRKIYAGWIKKGIALECGLVLTLAAMYGKAREPEAQPGFSTNTFSIEDDYIKWVDFTVSYEALCKAYDWDVDTHGSEHEIDWVELLAYTAARTGGTFDRDALKTMDKAAEKLSEGDTTIEELTEDLKYYSYYLEAYDAAIGGLVGVYWEEDTGAQTAGRVGGDVDGNNSGAAGGSFAESGIVGGAAGGNGAEESGSELSGSGVGGSGESGSELNGSGGGGSGESGSELDGSELSGSELDGSELSGSGRGRMPENGEGEGGRDGYVERYGLKGYFPLARGFDYTHYDDFGVSRSYGYQRQHLGHDMMGLVGTPIMAVESGYVEALGWNQYGGWRIGIRSFDGKRYYYYAHLRQNYPYAEGLEEGSVVTAGDVIGYMGHTGYSTTENVNNIKIVHLHWGLQLIFDESQKEGNNEIWIDLYPLTRFLAKHTQAAVKVEGTKEWVRTNQIVDPAVEEYEVGHKTQKEDDENRVLEQTR